MAASNLINMTDIQQLVDEMGDGAGEFFAELVDSLERDAAKSLSEMRAAIDHADGNALKRAAHRLKGSSASLGATMIATLCKELEIAGSDNDIADAVPMVERLEHVSTESLQALRELSL